MQKQSQTISQSLKGILNRTENIARKEVDRDINNIIWSSSFYTTSCLCLLLSLWCKRFSSSLHQETSLCHLPSPPLISSSHPSHYILLTSIICHTSFDVLSLAHLLLPHFSGQARLSSPNILMSCYTSPFSSFHSFLVSNSNSCSSFSRLSPGLLILHMQGSSLVTFLNNSLLQFIIWHKI